MGSWSNIFPVWGNAYICSVTQSVNKCLASRFCNKGVFLLCGISGFRVCLLDDDYVNWMAFLLFVLVLVYILALGIMISLVYLCMYFALCCAFFFLSLSKRPHLICSFRNELLHCQVLIITYFASLAHGLVLHQRANTVQRRSWSLLTIHTW